MRGHDVAGSSWREPKMPAAEPKAPPKDARCAACGGWIVTVPPGTTWATGRCGSKRCRLYGEKQRFTFRD